MECTCRSRRARYRFPDVVSVRFISFHLNRSLCLTACFIVSVSRERMNGIRPSNTYLIGMESDGVRFRTLLSANTVCCVVLLTTNSAGNHLVDFLSNSTLPMQGWLLIRHVGLLRKLASVDILGSRSTTRVKK